MVFDDFDDEIKGQLSLFDVEIPENVFAVSKIFARARKQMNLAELKTFVYALTNFKYTEECKNTMMLDKKTVAKIVGINSDINHLSVDLKRSIGKLPQNSFVEFEDKDLGFYESGCVINKIRMYENKIWIKFDEDYIKLFTKLEKDYIRMWSGDIFKMKSERSIAFYEFLRLNTDTSQDVCYRGFGIRALKELFGIPKDGEGSYMREDGHFARTHFERRIIDPIVEDLKNCKMINLLVQEDGKYYQKVKEHGRVCGYRFFWTYSEAPSVASASEVKEIQERIDKDPQMLRIAKNIVNGNPKPKLKKSYADYEQRNIDYDALADQWAEQGSTDNQYTLDDYE